MALERQTTGIMLNRLPVTASVSRTMQGMREFASPAGGGEGVVVKGVDFCQMDCYSLSSLVLRVLKFEGEVICYVCAIPVTTDSFSR